MQLLRVHLGEFNEAQLAIYVFYRRHTFGIWLLPRAKMEKMYVEGDWLQQDEYLPLENPLTCSSLSNKWLDALELIAHWNSYLADIGDKLTSLKLEKSDTYFSL